jgi:hypothetical protein
MLKKPDAEERKAKPGERRRLPPRCGAPGEPEANGARWSRLNRPRIVGPRLFPVWRPPHVSKQPKSDLRQTRPARR